MSHGATFCHALVFPPFILSCAGNKCVHSSLSLHFLSFLYSSFIQKILHSVAPPGALVTDRTLSVQLLLKPERIGLGPIPVNVKLPRGRVFG